MFFIIIQKLPVFIFGFVLLCNTQTLCCRSHSGVLQEEKRKERNGRIGHFEHQEATSKDGL